MLSSQPFQHMIFTSERNNKLNRPYSIEISDHNNVVPFSLQLKTTTTFTVIQAFGTGEINVQL